MDVYELNDNLDKFKEVVNSLDESTAAKNFSKDKMNELVRKQMNPRPTKFYFKIEAAQIGVVELIHKIGRTNKDPAKLFHLTQEFVNLTNFK